MATVDLQGTDIVIATGGWSGVAIGNIGSLNDTRTI